jgi:hypothetical protein
MRSIKTQAIIEGIRAKKDGSMGLTVSTPELSVQEKTLFFELQGHLLHLTIEPDQEGPMPEVEIISDVNQKTPSQRLRSVIFILWKQNSEDMDFPAYYNSKLEKIIQAYKDNIMD